MVICNIGVLTKVKALANINIRKIRTKNYQIKQKLNFDLSNRNFGWKFLLFSYFCILAPMATTNL